MAGSRIVKGVLKTILKSNIKLDNVEHIGFFEYEGYITFTKVSDGQRMIDYYQYDEENCKLSFLYTTLCTSGTFLRQ